MLRSMYAGVAGLKTHQTKMDVIGNNIANVNTTSFKSQSISFSDLMYQTTQRASGATETTGGVNARQIGLGAQSASIATAIETQGATQTTNNPYDLMISGDAFFIVNDGTQNVYTRDGSFYVDGNGNLATQSDGYYIMGWMAVTDEDTGVTSINTNGGLTKLQIMSDETNTFPPEGTSQAVISGNIDAKDTNITSSAGKTIALEFYDNLGYLYTAEFTIKDVDDEKNTYTMTLTDIMDSDGKSVGAEQLANVHLGSDEQAGVNTQVPGVLKSGYYVSNYSASKGTADFSISDGDITTTDTTMYSAIATKGTLSDLHSAGVLKELYNITIDDENFYADDTYTMDALGNLTISHIATTATTSKKSVVSETDTESYKVTIESSVATIEHTSKVGSLNASGDTFNKLGAQVRAAYGIGLDFSSTDEYHVKDNGNSLVLTVHKSTSNLSTIDGYTLNYSVANGASLDYETQKETTVYIPSTYDKLGEIAKYYGVTTSYADTDTFDILTDKSLVVYRKESKDLDSTNYDLTVNSNGTFTFTPTDGSAAIESVAGTGTLTTEIAAFYGITDISTYGDNPKYEISTDGTKLTVTYTTTADKYAIKQDKVEVNVSTGSATFTDKKGSFSTQIPTTGNLDDLSQSILGAFNISLDDYVTDSQYYQHTTYTINANGLTITTYEDTEPYELKTDEGYSKTKNGTSYYVYKTETVTDPVKGNMNELKAITKNAFGISSSDYDTTEPFDTYVISVNADGEANLTITDNSYKTVATEYNRNEMTLNYDHANGSYTGATFKQADGSDNGISYSTITTDKIIMNFNPDMDDTVNPWTDVYLDLSTTTNFNSSGTSTLQASKGDLAGNNTGRMMGTMTGITISKDGKISASYSNGQTLLLGQIASATFANASGLEKAGNNLYTATLNSGDPVVQDITVGGGSIQTGVLEMSNVDLSNEFTNMITAQRGFQANSRIITVSDTLLEELTNLKR